MWATSVTSWRESIYTYNAIGHYNPFSQDYDIVSHTTYVVCVNFIRESWELQFNVDPEWQIFWEAVFIEFKAQSSQWKRPKKARQAWSNMKVLLTVFINFNDVVHHNFLPQDHTANKEFSFTSIHNAITSPQSRLRPSFSHHSYCVR